MDDADYQVPFGFNATLSKVSIKLGPSQLLPEDHNAAAQDMKDSANK